MKKYIYFILYTFFLTSIYAQEVNFLDQLPHYIENLKVYEQGQEPPRAYHIPKEHISLNGKWKFYYAETPEGIPSNFYETSYNTKKWDDIPVPSNWEMLGYGDKQFRNISTTFSLGRPESAPADPYAAYMGQKAITEFTVVPPHVPKEYNPTGAYRKNFNLPKGWNNKEVFLRFEKISSASFVWVNGKEVGYNEGAQEPSEYNITPFLKEGKNTIAVMALKFSDGCYLEGQDYWRLSGIFDDVVLFATPKTRIWDWHVTTDLDKNYDNAQLSLKVYLRNHGEQEGNYTVKATVLQNGKTITEIKNQNLRVSGDEITETLLEALVNSPDKWTAETPNLYDLKMALYKDGNFIDEINTKIGFKETEIIGNTFYVNGVPIKVNSMNSHMQHPTQGHVMDEATIRKDFEILKQFNFNSVRTSHYPPVNKYLALANEYGLYVIDEAGVEAHATEYMSQMPEYVPMYLDRVRKMVIRDRNYPSILFWSAGNESGEGENITKVVQEGKKWDNTRYWMYGGNADKHPGEEIIGPRYPTPLELEMNYGLDKEDLRPSFMDEYLSIAGNGGGGMDEYWKVIYKHPRLMAGAIWDFVSPGLTEKAIRIPDVSPNNNPVHLMGNAKLVKQKKNTVLDLNGHDQWLEFYRSKSLEINSDALTIALDVFPRKLNSSSGVLISKGNNQFGIQQIGKDSLQFYVYTDKKHSLTVPVTKAWQNNWHKVIAQYNGQEISLTIDGISLGKTNVSGKIQNFPFPINIGRDVETHGQDTYVYLVDAQIDNVAIFNTIVDDIDKVSSKDALVWLNFENQIDEGEYYSYGIGARTYGAIWPDRTPQPEMWQMKKTVQPLSFSLLDVEKGLIEVWNRNGFLNANHWNTKWTLTEDDKVLQEGVLNLDVAALEKGTTKIPITKPTIKPGKEYRLNLSSTLKQEELWAKKGFEISWDQLPIKKWFVSEIPKSVVNTKLDISENEKEIRISGSNFTYTISKEIGNLSSIIIDGKEVLEQPLQLNAWRAPIANEIDHWNGGALRTKKWKAGYGNTIATDYYSSGIHNLKHQPIDIQSTNLGNTVKVTIRTLALTNNGKKNYTLLDRYISGLALSGFESLYQFTITGDGTINIDHKIDPQGSMPQMLPRIGLTTMLSESFNQINWYGKGPQENYPDRKTGYKIGTYKSSVAQMHVPYLIPQDNGLRTDNRWLKITDATGTGLEISMDQNFNFNVSPYSTENLTNALYTYQLTKAKGNTLNLDYKTTGLGGTARAVMEQYRAYPQQYNRTITISPILNKK